MSFATRDWLEGGWIPSIPAVRSRHRDSRLSLDASCPYVRSVKQRGIVMRAGWVSGPSLPLELRRDLSYTECPKRSSLRIPSASHWRIRV